MKKIFISFVSIIWFATRAYAVNPPCGVTQIAGACLQSGSDCSAYEAGAQCVFVNSAQVCAATCMKDGKPANPRPPVNQGAESNGATLP